MWTKPTLGMGDSVADAAHRQAIADYTNNLERICRMTAPRLGRSTNALEDAEKHVENLAATIRRCFVGFPSLVLVPEAFGPDGQSLGAVFLAPCRSPTPSAPAQASD